jgi:hypothetical protein
VRAAVDQVQLLLRALGRALRERAELDDRALALLRRRGEVVRDARQRVRLLLQRADEVVHRLRHPVHAERQQPDGVARAGVQPHRQVALLHAHERGARLLQALPAPRDAQAQHRRRDAEEPDLEQDDDPGDVDLREVGAEQPGGRVEADDGEDEVPREHRRHAGRVGEHEERDRQHEVRVRPERDREDRQQHGVARQQRVHLPAREAPHPKQHVRQQGERRAERRQPEQQRHVDLQAVHGPGEAAQPQREPDDQPVVDEVLVLVRAEYAHVVVAQPLLDLLAGEHGHLRGGRSRETDHGRRMAVGR